MKHFNTIFLGLIFCSINISGFGQVMGNKFILNGNITGARSGKIYLGYGITKFNKVVNDSAIIEDGKFKFTVNIFEPTVAFISLHKSPEMDSLTTIIFLEPANMLLNLDKNNFQLPHLTGSLTESDYEQINAIALPLRKKYIENSRIINNSTGVTNSLQMDVKKIKDSINKIHFSSFSKHPSSYLTAFLLQSHFFDLSIDSITLFYNRLSPELKESNIGKNIFQKVGILKNGSVGSIAKPFSAKTANNSYLTSYSLKGKYVLLDFWASWCGPCREKSGHLIGLYNKYKSKGLTIVGIADNDNDTIGWKKAIEKDKTGNWVNILRGMNKEAIKKGLNDPNDISDKYGVNLIPALILINPEGIIIGRYESDTKSLDEKLAAIFKN